MARTKEVPITNPFDDPDVLRAVVDKVRADLTPDTSVQRQALDQLAVLGGKLLGDDDIAFHKGGFVLPEQLTLRKASQVLSDRADADEEENEFVRIFNYRPFDGALAAQKAMRQAFGFTSGKTLWSMWGDKQPPQHIDVEVGPHNQTERCPWGAMHLPVLGGTLTLGGTKSKDYGDVFYAQARVPHKYRFEIEGLFKLIQHFLETESIYKGKAVDGDGHFINTAVIDPTTLVYTDSVARRLDGDLWSFIRYGNQLQQYGQSGKYAVLLSGPWGSGKTETAGITAQIANDHGWTFLMARPGQDNLMQALQMARLYPPAIVFAEDIDTKAGAGQTDINECLDMIDGFHAKGQKLIVVFTTNHADRIHKGMLRPGRIGAVIHLGAMDRWGIEKLARRVVPSLDPDVDFDKVAEAMDGYMPAFVREAFNRALRYSVASHDGVLGPVGTNELTDAADGLRDQLKLMQEAKTDGGAASVGTELTKLFRGAIEGVKVTEDGDNSSVYYELHTNGE